MTKKYDIVVVGAGPAGLMAARTAADSGLKVLLVERKSDPVRNQRLCGQFTNISLINVGGRLKYGYTKPVSIEVGTGGVKLHFSEFGFHLDYAGPLRPYMNYIYVSPSGNLVYREKNRLFGFYCDKEALLSGIFKSVERLGVDVMTGTFGVRAENTGHGVQVTLKTPVGEEKVTARKCIAADGKESAIAESAGLNAGRKVLSRTPIRLAGYMLEGVATELRINSWINITVPSLNPAGNFWMYLLADDCNMVGGGAPAQRSPSDNVDALMKLPAFRLWFERSRIVRRFAVASGGPVYAPNPEPLIGNVMAIGDAAALVEVTNPGAIACGYAAVRALLREMDGDRNAIPEYFRWWQSSFDTNDAEYLKAAGRNFMINAMCNDGEIDYLYGLLKDRVGLPAAGIAENMERVRTERPELYQKLSRAGMASNIADVRLNLSDVLNAAGQNSHGAVKS